MNKISNKQLGFGHLGALAVIVVVGVVGFAGWRVLNKEDTKLSVDNTVEQELVEELPNNLEGVKTLEEIELIAGVNEEVSIISFVLETQDGVSTYKIILSDGRKLTINATTGKVLSEETTDVSDDDKIPANITVTVSPSEAYSIASKLSGSLIKQIELEVEDDKVTYKVEFKDGSKVEIDATNGSVVKSEIKNESKVEEDKDGEDQEDEAEPEDEEDKVDNEDAEDN